MGKKVKETPPKKERGWQTLENILTLLVISEMQVKTTMIHFYTSTRVTTI